MKIIKFDIADTQGFEALQSKIHSYLLSKNGVDGFRYVANCWNDINNPIKNLSEGKIGVFIEENEPRYSYIISCLDQSEIDSIETISDDWINN